MLTDSHAAHFQDKDEIDFAFSRGRGSALDVQVSRNTFLDEYIDKEGTRPNEK
jgi:hypothetical protein